jgi:RimJ/RimL family protein N-acetyltransferase
MTDVDGSDAWSTVPTLHGRHVSLAPLRAADAEGLATAAADGELWNLWYTNVPEPAQVERWIADALAMQEDGGALAFTLRDASDRIVGSTRYYDLLPSTPRLQIGYTWHAASAQRTGINTEAKLLLLAHAFEAMGCASVGLQTSTRNATSRAAIARLGAKEEGIIRQHLRHRDGSLRDTVNFSILDSEWPAVKAGLQSKLAARGDG